MKKIIFSTVLVCFVITSTNAQRWVQMMSDTNANFYDIVKEFDAYWKDKPYERGKGYKQFKRWQWFAEPRVYPSGDMRLASRGHAYEEFQKYLSENSMQRHSGNGATISSTVANWAPLGPFGQPGGGQTGAGRVQVILKHPTQPNTIFVGAAAGGLWVSTNGGSTYTTTTDQIASLGVSDIAIDPVNTNNIYISTGDKDAGDTHATGVLKSTDAGATWNTTGLTWQTSQQRRIYRLLINPLNPNTLIVASSVGIYRSLDGGANWTLIIGGNFTGAEYRPGDTTTVYAVGSGVFKSTNGGGNFVSITIPNVSYQRLSMAVTPANNNYVYVLVGSTNNGFGGLMRSTNAGNSFVLMSTTPNIFDWSTTGNGTGGQAWYDIFVGASPTNADEIICGGVNSWKSTNGGSNWTLNTHWTGSGGRPYVHADLHYVYYTSGTSVYLGTDGGVWVTNNSGSTYSSLNGNMNIAQIYKLGISASTPTRIITGMQDNGTNLSSGTGTVWSQGLGGDGMDCFIDWNNNLNMVGSQYQGSFFRSSNGGTGWSSINSGAVASGAGPWVSPIQQDPVTPSRYYCGFNDVFVSTNNGTGWIKMSNINGTINQIKAHPLNNNYVFASTASGLFRTMNGLSNGSSVWSAISGSVPSVGSVSDFAFDNQNPNTLYITLSGYNAGNKVFRSYDGGVNWVNLSQGLPNIPVDCIVFVKNSAQQVYIGTDAGVYYRDGSMNSWQYFSNGLPNAIVNDMEIFYPSGKLRAATYGRSVWETDLYSNPGVIPTAAFYNNYGAACVNTQFNFQDVSSNNPTSWSWSFPGGTPASSSLQNPQVAYSTAGIYTVTLVSTNSVGPSAPYITTISVVNVPTVNPVPLSICKGQSGQLTISTNGTFAQWSSGQSGLAIQVNNTVTTAYNFTVFYGACTTVGQNTVVVDTIIPSTPNVYLFGSYLTTTASANSYTWYFNGSIIPGANLSTYTPTQSGYYSIGIANGACAASSSSYYYQNDVSVGSISADVFQTEIKPNPVKDVLNLKFKGESGKEVKWQIMNLEGQLVYTGTVKCTQTQCEAAIQINDLNPGVYFVVLSNNKGSGKYKFVKE